MFRSASDDSEATVSVIAKQVLVVCWNCLKLASHWLALRVWDPTTLGTADISHAFGSSFYVNFTARKLGSNDDDACSSELRNKFERFDCSQLDRFVILGK